MKLGITETQLRSDIARLQKDRDMLAMAVRRLIKERDERDRLLELYRAATRAA